MKNQAETPPREVGGEKWGFVVGVVGVSAKFPKEIMGNLGENLGGETSNAFLFSCRFFSRNLTKKYVANGLVPPPTTVEIY